MKPPDLQADVLQESGVVPSLPGNSPAFPKNVNPFGLVGVSENVEASEVEPSNVNAHKRGGVLPVVGAVPTLAEGTPGVEPAGEAEKAATAKSEALVPWAQDNAGRRREVKTPLRRPEAPPPEGWRNHELPPQNGELKEEALPQRRERERARTRAKREPKADVLPQGSPDEGEHEPN